MARSQPSKYLKNTGITGTMAITKATTRMKLESTARRIQSMLENPAHILKIRISVPLGRTNCSRASGQKFSLTGRPLRPDPADFFTR